MRLTAAVSILASLATVIGLAAGSAFATRADERREAAPAIPGATGLPLPRFASLKSDRVHARQGPSTEHKVLWVYRRAGLPIEVIREFEGWRQVRDSDGAEGWVAQILVSQRRTALIVPWETQAGQATKVELLADDRAGAAPVAIVEAGVIANVRSCDTRWCHVSVGDYRGYIEQKKLWGVYPNETVKP